MEINVTMESEDFEIVQSEDLTYITFYANDKTSSKIEILIPDYAIQSFKKQVKKLI